MKTNIFYYSSTGNSLYVAKRIASEIEDSEIISMATAVKEKNFNYHCNKAIFIYPVHCFGLPVIAFNFLENLKIENCTYIYGIAVSGGGKGDNTFKQLKYLLPALSINNYTTLKYVSNYIKEGRNATIERIEKSDLINEPLIDKIIKEITTNHSIEENIKKSKGALTNRAWKKFFIGKSNFNVNEDCIGCKICEKVCPIQNICLKDNRPTWSNHCVDCMGCINLCPQKAINIGTKTKKKNRYKNKNVSSSELFIN